MKAAILFISLSYIGILQADAQENDYAELCAQCNGSTLPKCESTGNARLDKKIDCSQTGCIIAMTTNPETEYVCLMDVKSQEAVISEPKDESAQFTTLPVPLALQMVTTTANADPQMIPDAAEDIEMEAKVVDDAGQHMEEKESVKVASAEDGNKQEQKQEQEQNMNKPENSAEKVAEPKPIEKEVEEKPAVDADNAPQPAASSAEVGAESESAAAEQVPASTPNSPDYPADAPAMNSDNTNEEQEINEPAKGGNNVTPTVLQNVSENGDDSQETLASNKDQEVVNHVDQAAPSGAEHSETTTKANEVEAAVHVADAGLQGAASAGTNEAGNVVEPVVIAMTVPPAAAAANQFLTCYSCTSTTDRLCVAGPVTAVNCQAMENKINGCYTLYKADTNITTRGCISELTDEGLKYCELNPKQCILCYEKGCNNLLAPSDAARSNSQLSFWVGVGGFMCFTFLL
ncbi:uncharacterized protein LOC128863794 isoform X1 [Anastrepha ludens]|uniref:uncharacterized protein LOC128863794 isoform X1 n=1 Tax=Anastrepha ludens TaxID=28586 RepID=UPI0023AEBF7E|nr:uncharacterized protein LOC128863794 isoform X1 [Anastrepha ludens]XP_053959118.1 uncharacterized protein LOC128863794 isoform X1 [Anastrepha ludens]